MRATQQQRLMRLAISELRKRIVESRDTLTVARVSISRGRSLTAQARVRVARGSSWRGIETPSPNSTSRR